MSWLDLKRSQKRLLWFLFRLLCGEQLKYVENNGHFESVQVIASLLLPQEWEIPEISLFPLQKLYTWLRSDSHSLIHPNRISLPFNYHRHRHGKWSWTSTTWKKHVNSALFIYMSLFATLPPFIHALPCALVSRLVHKEREIERSEKESEMK